jgi:hypothetical protein
LLRNVEVKKPPIALFAVFILLARKAQRHTFIQIDSGVLWFFQFPLFYPQSPIRKFLSE